MFSLVLLSVVTASLGAESPATVENLRCEYRVDPLGIDVRRPAALLADARHAPRGGPDRLPGPRGLDARQARRATKPTSGIAAAWHRPTWPTWSMPDAHSPRAQAATGKSASGTPTARPPGTASRPCGAWACWSRADWRARWIGLDGGDEPALLPTGLQKAQWIWFPEAKPAANAPVGTRFFRRQFEVPAGRQIRAAGLAVAADNRAVVFVNGRKLGPAQSFHVPADFDLAEIVHPGMNTIAVQATNAGDGPKPGPA